MKDLQGFEFAPAVNRVASYLLSTKRADVLGNMREDYVSELAMLAIVASRRFKKERGGCRKQEARYVYKSLWNYARYMNRERVASKNRFFQSFEEELDPISLEEQIEVRDSLRALRERLSPVNWQILERLGEANNSIPEAWKMDPSCDRKYFHQKVNRARTTAKRILRQL